MAKVLRVGLLAPPNTLDPRKARDLVSTVAVAQVFERPYMPPRGEGTAAPLLFDGPLERESDTVYAGRLRPGLVFSDGTPLTAAHVAVSLAHVEALGEQATVEARGERIVFTLKAPNPRFELALTVIHCGIVLERPGRLLGTGAFMPAPGSTLQDLRLVRNPHHRRPPALDEVVFKVHPPDKDGRPQALLEAIAAGQVDFTNMLSRNDAAGVSGMRKQFLPSLSTASLYFNTERDPLRNPVVRRALALGVDRLALAEVSYSNALAFAATSLIPPPMGAARDGLEPDLQKARALLAQAGTARTGRLRMLVVWAPRPYLPHPQPVAEAVVGQLGQLGVEVAIDTPRSSDDFFRTCERGDYDMVLAGWIADTPDPADFLESNLRSDRVQTPGQPNVGHINLGRFRNASMDAALKRFRRDPSAGNRDAILKLMADEMPLLPLMHGPLVVVSAWRVHNVELSSLGEPDFSAVDLD